MYWLTQSLLSSWKHFLDADDAYADPVLERLVEETEKGWHGRTTSRQRLSLGSNYDAVMARINKA